MPFGLSNAPQTFQRFMDLVFQGLDFVFVYLDEFLVGSRTKEDHRKHLVLVFDCLEELGLVIKLQKCQFAASDMVFLGHRITPNGIFPVKDKAEAI